MLKRIFITNWKTTACGALLLLIWVTFLAGKLSETAFLTLVAPVIATAMALSKDGVREETKVAREDVPTDTPPSP
jgi:hypothetical protein